MIQIDNVKMWESLLNPKHHSEVLDSLKPWIKDALKEQGLEFKDGHIVSIMSQGDANSETEVDSEYDELKFKLAELIRLYLGVKDIKVDSFEIDLNVSSNGKKLFDILSVVSPVNNSIPKEFIKEEMEHIKDYRERALKMLDKIEKECEEEMTKEPHFKVGDRIKSDTREYTVYEICDNYYRLFDDECGAVAMHMLFIDQDKFKLVEPNQENSPVLSNSLNTAKNDEGKGFSDD